MYQKNFCAKTQKIKYNFFLSKLHSIWVLFNLPSNYTTYISSTRRFLQFTLSYSLHMEKLSFLRSHNKLPSVYNLLIATNFNMHSSNLTRTSTSKPQIVKLVANGWWISYSDPVKKICSTYEMTISLNVIIFDRIVAGMRSRSVFRRCCRVLNIVLKFFRLFCSARISIHDMTLLL